MGDLAASTDHSIKHFFVPIHSSLGLPDGYTAAVVEDPGTYSGRGWTSYTSDRRPPTAEEVLRGPLLRFWRCEHETFDPLGLGYKAAIQLLGIASGGQADLLEREAVVCEIILDECAVDGEDALRQLLDSGLTLLRAWQRAWHRVTRDVVQLAARENLPFVLTIATARIDSGHYIAPDGVGLWLHNENTLDFDSRPTLTDRDLGEISMILEASDLGPFSIYLDLLREADLSARLRGDYRSAVITTASACETFLDELLGRLLWEEGVRPEDAVSELDPSVGVVVRVRSNYHGRLGGVWNDAVGGPVQRWRTSVAVARNRVVHGGAEPSRKEADEAVAATRELVAWVISRLTTPSVMAQYPHTTLAVVGESGLRRRNAYTKRMAAAAHRAMNEQMHEVFSRWYKTVGRCLDRGVGLAVEPDSSRSYTYVVLMDDAASYWCEHDRVACMARLVQSDHGLLTEAQAEALEGGIPKVGTEADGAPLVGTLELEESASPIGAWSDEYHLIPGASVMFNGDDLAREAT